MNKQNGSLERLESCVAELTSISHVRDIARKVFECEFHWFDQSDPIVVEGAFPVVRVFYVCTEESRSDQRAYVDCRLDFNACEMWFGNLHVAAAYRMGGLGRALVQVSETMAAAMKMREIYVFPLRGSLGFWCKMGYASTPGATLVLHKNVVERTIQ